MADPSLRAKRSNPGARAPRLWPWIASSAAPPRNDGGARIETATGLSRLTLLAGIVVVVVFAALPGFAGREAVQNLIFVFYMLALAEMWNLLAGYAGLVSVGQQAFVGLGGYLLFACAIMAGINPLVAIPLAGVGAGLAALLAAPVIFRLSGAYFAIGTWVVAEVWRLIFAQIRDLGGGTGMSLPTSVVNGLPGLHAIRAWFDVRIPAARDILDYWVALAIAVLAIAAAYAVLRSRLGLALSAIRDSEAASGSAGVNNFRTKLLVYVFTAFGTGMVGALIYLQKARISPDSAFSVLDWTAYVIVIVVIGGIGTLEGPIVGVLVFYLLQTYLADYGTWYLILLGALAIAVMLFAPYGIWGYLSRRFGVVLLPVRRRLVLPKDP